MSTKSSDIVAVMQGWIGYSEKNGKFKKIIDIYNSHPPLARGYAVKYTDEWCATTVSAAAIACGDDMVELIGTECSCNEFIKIFKNKGIWIEDGTVTPKPGYIVLYAWSKSTQPNDAAANHIGIIEKVQGNTIVAIEGNKSEAVARRTFPIGWGYIRGYGAPKYSDYSSDAPVNKPTTVALNTTVKWTGIVTCSSLNVRVGAGTGYARNAKYPSLTKNTKVSVCDQVADSKNGTWYYIRLEGKYGVSYGYVSSLYINRVQNDPIIKADPTITPDNKLDKEPAWKGTVTASVLNVRSGAGTNYPNLKTVPTIAKGTTVEICDILNGNNNSLWYFVRINGKTYGFVSANYIKKTAKI